MKLPKYLTKEQSITLLNSPYFPNLEHKLIIYTGLHGLRCSEICNLKIKDINVRDRFLTVRQGKGAKDRIVPITPDYARQLEDYIKMFNMQPADNLFHKTRQGIYQLVRGYGKKSGIEEERGEPINVHMLRHTYAVLSLKAGVDIKNLQTALGHKNLNTTAVYLQLTAEDLIAAYRNHPLPY